MTDYKKVKTLFMELGIAFKEDKNHEKMSIDLETDTEKVIGYIGFVTYFEFNLDESFRNVAIYE